MLWLALTICARAALLAGLLAPGSMSEGAIGPPDVVRPRRVLSDDEAELWRRGRELFHREWTPHEGLGTPAFNATWRAP